MRVNRHRAGALIASLTLAAAVAACGSSGTSTGGDATAASTSSKADVAAAKALIAPYVGKPSAFPVDTPLPRALPKGTRIGFLQCATPVCAVFGQLFAAATKTMGAQLQAVKAGPSADALQSALSTIVEKKPAGILVPGIEPDSVATQLKAAANAAIPMASNGIMGAERYGFGAQTLGVRMAVLSGRLLAGWAVANKGDKAKIAFYDTPELSFTSQVRKGFTTEMAKLCPSCSVRDVTVPVASIGNSAPSLVVSDLQSHPDTNLAVFATQEASTGLPAALKTAGLSVEVVGFAPSPANLQDIKSGQEAAGLGVDTGTLSWTLVDELARLILKAPLTAGERSTIMPMQFLTAKDLTGDVSQGWSGYPDFAKRFAKLWHAG